MADPESILESLKEIALQDGVISDEENTLISSVIGDLRSYLEQLENCKNNKLNESDNFTLFEMKMRIVENAYKIARVDDNISADEKKLLLTICKYVNQI